MRIFAALIFLATLAPTVSAQEARSPLEKYRQLEFPAIAENFDKGWMDRVALEFEVVNSADIEALRAGLEDEDMFVRAMAARALGIRKDIASANALSELAQNDPEYPVRIRAVESLGLLKMNRDLLEILKKDKHGSVSWVADLALEQLGSDQDFAAQVRSAFAEGIDRDEMGAAKVGQAAPDFTAQTLDGQPFKLSSVLGKKPIVIYFAAFDS